MSRSISPIPKRTFKAVNFFSVSLLFFSRSVLVSLRSWLYSLNTLCNTFVKIGTSCLGMLYVFSKIQKMANALGVSIKSLFEPSDDVEGYIRIGKRGYQFNSREELDTILKEKSGKVC